MYDIHVTHVYLFSSKERFLISISFPPVMQLQVELLKESDIFSMLTILKHSRFLEHFEKTSMDTNSINKTKPFQITRHFTLGSV